MFAERGWIDPDGRYPAGGYSDVEELALRVLALLPEATFERTRDAIQIADGGEEGIGVLVTPEAIELCLPTVEWHGPHAPAASSRRWKRVRARDLSDERIAELLIAARRARQRQFRRCRYCGERVPPEHRIDDDVCHGCASKHLHVVF